MDYPNNINIPDSLYTLSLSIQTSPQVYLWAYMIVCHQRHVINQINNNKITTYIKSIQKFNNIKKLLCFISLISAISAIYCNAYTFLFMNTIILFITILYVPSQIKRLVANIACYLIKKHGGTYVHKDKVSMYMIAEEYSRAHKIPSLIDIIFYTDYINRVGGIIATVVVIAAYSAYPDYILHLIISYYLIFHLICIYYIRLSFSYKLISTKTT